MTTWLITGCSTGLGRALATAILDESEHESAPDSAPASAPDRTPDTVVVTARDAAAVQDLVDAHPDRALGLALDVTDPEQVRAAVAAAEERFGAVDVLVNNAGYGYRAAVEEGEPDAVATLFATHVHGPVDLMKAVLPGMRARRSGAIVNISSIGARVSPAGSGYYSAVKAATEALSSSLRKEVGPLGIDVMVVEPGGFRTDFAGRSLTQSAEPIADYADTAGKRRIEHDTVHGTQPGDPAKAASAIVRAVRAEETPFMLVLGDDAVTGIRAALGAVLADVDTWEATSRATGF